jgi:hypothetical protein
MGDAVDTQQTTSSPAPTSEETPTAEGDGETEADAADGATPAGEGDGPTVIGGEETGLTLEIPDKWVDIPMDTEAMSEDFGALDFPDDQAAFIESSISELGSVDGVVMAIDSSTFGSGAVAIVTANCAPNINSLGEDNLGPAIEFDLEGIAENIEIEEATVDGLPAARATYSLSVEGLQGERLQYVVLADDDMCWVTFTAADESRFGEFDDIAATISML